jgi:hypothetical protein
MSNKAPSDVSRVSTEILIEARRHALLGGWVVLTLVGLAAFLAKLFGAF